MFPLVGISQIPLGCCLLYPVSTLSILFFFFSILALTIILKLFISIFVFSKRLLFFEGQSRKHFTFIVYALPSHITLSASQSSGAQEGIGKSKLSEERVEE